MPTLVYGTTPIDYTIEYQEDRKDISISVEWLDGVQVVAPKGMPEENLAKAIRKKAPWILNKWNQFNEIHQPTSKKEFCSGEKFSYLGRYYRLKVLKTNENEKAALQYMQGKFIATVPRELTGSLLQEEMRELFKVWYISNGERKIQERLKLYAPKMLLNPSKVVLKEQKMRWGSCTADNAIYLNWRLMMAPMAVIDYVLVHELAHIKYPNHSTDFWQFVNSILPDYEERKEWLRVNGPLLSI
jgi:predicted metal-dependent hydrolase